MLGTLHDEFLGSHNRGVGASSLTAVAWGTANMARFVPFHLDAPYLVNRVWWANGATVAGNVDCGIYSESGRLLASIGSTVMAGATTIQSAALGTPLLLMPGRYYMALASSSTTATFQSLNLPATYAGKVMGVAQQSAALPLPATFTLATLASPAIAVICGIARTSVL